MDRRINDGYTRPGAACYASVRGDDAISHCACFHTLRVCVCVWSKTMYSAARDGQAELYVSVFAYRHYSTELLNLLQSIDTRLLSILAYILGRGQVTVALWIVICVYSSRRQCTVP